MRKRRVRIRRKDGVRQHYWKGKKRRRKQTKLSFFTNTARFEKIREEHTEAPPEPDRIAGSIRLTRAASGGERILKKRRKASHPLNGLARPAGDGLTKAEYCIHYRWAQF